MGIKIQRACLVTAAQVAIKYLRHLVFDFVAKTNEKPEIILSVVIYGTVIVVQAAFELPVLLCAVFGPVVCLTLPLLLEVPVVYSL